MKRAEGTRVEGARPDEAEREESAQASRAARIERVTSETDIRLTLDLDVSGRVSVDTGFGLLDHMLTLTAFWADFDLTLTCRGDLDIDAHHTAEDVGLTLGRRDRGPVRPPLAGMAGRRTAAPRSGGRGKRPVA